MNNPTELPLEDLEIIAIKGIQAREREVQDKYVIPLREDFRRLTRLITQRLGLAPDALGTTHQLNFENFRVIPAPEPEQAKQPEQASSNGPLLAAGAPEGRPAV